MEGLSSRAQQKGPARRRPNPAPPPAFSWPRPCSWCEPQVERGELWPQEIQELEEELQHSRASADMQLTTLAQTNAKLIVQVGPHTFCLL